MIIFLGIMTEPNNAFNATAKCSAQKMAHIQRKKEYLTLCAFVRWEDRAFVAEASLSNFKINLLIQRPFIDGTELGRYDEV